MDFQQLTTEQPHPASRNLDCLSIREIIALMNREDAQVAPCVAPALPAIEQAIQALTAAWQQGRNLFFIGAGTSGRLGVMEAAECPPTFNTPPERIQAIIAGGRDAVFQSQEGAEDNRAAGEEAIREHAHRGDAVIGIAASGVTPFVQAGLSAARSLSCLTILITCQPAERAAGAADIVIAVPVGPEILTGSTRLKAATATKMVLNMLTLGTMVCVGKVYDNLMVDVQPKSRKLQARARHIVQQITGLAEDQAEHVLQDAGGDVKLAITMQHLHLDKAAAQQKLIACNHNLREVLTSAPAALRNR
jgi:N-acetylmuramic acid 6-phosphate etherase